MEEIKAVLQDIADRLGEMVALFKEAAEGEALVPLDTKTLTTPTRLRLTPDWHSIFEYWMETCNYPRAKFTDDRKAKLRARLREGYTLTQIAKGIRGCSYSKFHMGENDDGKKYADFSLILRNGEKLDFFIDLCEEMERGRKPSRPVRVPAGEGCEETTLTRAGGSDGRGSTVT